MHKKKRISFKGKNMKIKYANESFQKLGIGDPTTWVYQLIYDERYSSGTYLLCIVINS